MQPVSFSLMTSSPFLSRIFLVAAVTLAGGVASWTQGESAAAGDIGSGRIAGVVEFKGKPPARAALRRDTDPVCARTPRLSEDVVVSEGKLADVHVRIKVGTAGKHAAPARPAEVNQLECMYTPRVVGIVEGQSVAIKNSDPTYHNVRGAKAKRTVWNLGQPPSAPAIVRKDLGKAGEVVSLHCDVHPWMRAYAVITDHPYFSVTAADGAFAIDKVPPGTYTLEAWHPELGLKSATVTVHKGKTARATFRF
jgi:plastocyanin